MDRPASPIDSDSEWESPSERVRISLCALQSDPYAVAPPSDCRITKSIVVGEKYRFGCF